ncbi:MAG TPA: FKBP-type peptidyl-prolyl cis-trans isomerase [Candidatus Paceibacterota bacterium]|nr:FKBP-type peptidyl-prolyl cis-trans isomerase [Candidatus Paceibacterota bacterium]
MKKTIVSVIIIAAVIVVGWLLMKSNNKSTGMNDNQQGVYENILAEGKLKTVTTVEGSGAESKLGDKVTVNYTGTLTNGTVFDSSIPRGEPFMFTLGEGRVIQGWELGVLGMKVGEKRTLTIAPELGYGDANLGTIPPNSTLIFEVELLAIN